MKKSNNNKTTYREQNNCVIADTIKVNDNIIKSNERFNDLMRDSIMSEQSAFRIIEITSEKMKKYAKHCTRIQHIKSNKKFYCYSHYNDIQFNINTAFYEKLDERDRELIEEVCEKHYSSNLSEVEFKCKCLTQSIDNMLNQFIDLLNTFDYVLTAKDDDYYAVNTDIEDEKLQYEKSKEKTKK